MLKNFMYCLGMFVLCLIPVLIILGTIKLKTKMCGEPFRKLLHTVAYLCPISIVSFATSWQTAALVMAFIGAAIYPILRLAEKSDKFAPFFHQRKDGEVRKSLLQLFFGGALLICLCWGIFGKPYLVSCAILMWGPGDAAAALLGRKYGKHKINLPLADKKKSWEGSLSFVIVSFVFGSVWLAVFSELSLLKVLMTALITSVAGAYTELITHNGYDTVTVPFANAIVLLALHSII